MASDNKSIKQNPFVIEKSASIKEAMRAISANQKGVIVVIDKNERLVGVLSDGDIRRALLREASLITPIEKVMNINYIFYHQDMKEKPDFMQMLDKINKKLKG